MRLCTLSILFLLAICNYIHSISLFLFCYIGWYGDLWWTDGLPANCTIEDMEKVLSHSLAVVQYPVFSETDVSSLGLVSQSLSLVSPLLSMCLSVSLSLSLSLFLPLYPYIWIKIVINCDPDTDLDTNSNIRVCVCKWHGLHERCTAHEAR